MGNTAGSTDQGPVESGKDGSTSKNIRLMDRRLQARLRKGVDVNVKVLIRGDRRTGKTTLLERLQGNKDLDFGKYHATPEIGVSHVHWRNRVTDEVVKIEAWDVVDRALSEEEIRDGMQGAPVVNLDEPAGIPLTEEMYRSVQRRGSHSVMPLDSTVVDVYRNAHACIFIYDPHRRETFEHMKNLAIEAPPDLSLAFLRNFRDLTDQRHHHEVYDDSSSDGEIDHGTVSMSEMEQFIAQLKQRSAASNTLFHFECSLKDSFGLRLLYDYLRIPFLVARKTQLLQQLAFCEAETTKAEGEMTKMINSHDYHKRRSSSQNKDVHVAVVVENRPKPTTTVAKKREEPVRLHHGQQGENASSLLDDAKAKAALDAFLDDVSSEDEADKRIREQVQARAIVESCLIESQTNDEAIDMEEDVGEPTFEHSWNHLSSRTSTMDEMEATAPSLVGTNETIQQALEMAKQMAEEQHKLKNEDEEDKKSSSKKKKKKKTKKHKKKHDHHPEPQLRQQQQNYSNAYSTGEDNDDDDLY